MQSGSAIGFYLIFLCTIREIKKNKRFGIILHFAIHSRYATCSRVVHSSVADIHFNNISICSFAAQSSYHRQLSLTRCWRTLRCHSDHRGSHENPLFVIPLHSSLLSSWLTHSEDQTDSMDALRYQFANSTNRTKYCSSASFWSSTEKYHFSVLFSLVGKVGHCIVHNFDKK